jgi:hypothetical protein
MLLTACTVWRLRPRPFHLARTRRNARRQHRRILDPQCGINIHILHQVTAGKSSNQRCNQKVPRSEWRATYSDQGSNHPRRQQEPRRSVPYCRTLGRPRKRGSNQASQIPHSHRRRQPHKPTRPIHPTQKARSHHPRRKPRLRSPLATLAHSIFAQSK